MSNALIDIVGIFPVQIVFAYALSRMLVMRNATLYWTLEIVSVLLLACFRSQMDVGVRFLAALPLALLPIALSEGALSRRILAVVLAHLVLFFVELPGGALWVALTGTPIADYDASREHFGAFLLTHAAHLALLVVLLAVLCLLFYRFADSAQKEGRWLPVAFTVVQLMLVNIVLLLPFGYIESSAFYYAFSVPLSLLGLAADLLLLFAMGRVAQKRRADARAALLEEQLDRYLVRYECFVEDVEQVAKLRHDMKNHVQVVLALSECKRIDEARGHLGLVRDVFDAASVSEGRAS